MSGALPATSPGLWPGFKPGVQNRTIAKGSRFPGEGRRGNAFPIYPKRMILRASLGALLHIHL